MQIGAERIRTGGGGSTRDTTREDVAFLGHVLFLNCHTTVISAFIPERTSGPRTISLRRYWRIPSRHCI